MPLFVEVAIAYAQRIALPSNFDLKTLSVMMENLNAYEPSLSCTPAVSEGGELPEQVAKRACVTSSVLAMDEGKSYKVITYYDAVDDYSFGGALMSAFEAAACIGCGACVAACKNSSAMLFVGAKVSQYALLPQGKVEGRERVLNMVRQMDEEGFGNCTNTGACEVECPKGISIENIARMNRELIKAAVITEKK